MPSLRVRNERKSYSNIAEGLEQLDDSDIEEGAKDEFVGGSPSSVIIDIDAPNSDDDESLSSGSSSEFRPDGPPAERDSRPLVEEEDEDDDAISEDHVSDEDSPPAPEELKVEDEDPPIMPITREKLPNKPTHPKSQVHVPSRKAAPPTYLQTDTNLLLPAYREIIRTSSHSLAKNIPSNEDGEVTKKGEAERDKYRQLGMEVYPIGPVTPFVTRLTTPPEPGGGGVKWVEGESDVRERREARQKRGYAITRTVPGSSPWETWEGEGWWPEMFNEGFQGGEGRMPGWKLREEVRLGFDDVGRASLDDLQFLSKRDAETYLPKAVNLAGKPFTTCYLGIHDKQKPVNFKLFDQQSINPINPTKKGYIFCAGGPIWGLDWCPYPARHASRYGHTQYFAVSTTTSIGTPAKLGGRVPRDTKACIQIWSVTPFPPSGDMEVDVEKDGDTKETIRCETVLCIEGGAAMQIKWMPLGAWDELDSEPKGNIAKLGILAAVQLDGTVGFYSLPHPIASKQSRETGGSEEPIFLRCHNPLIRLEVDDSTITCMDWMTGTRLATGLSNGHGAVWDIGDALRSGESDSIPPAVYMTIALSAVRTVTAGRLPPNDANGDPLFDHDPFILFFGCYDGTICVVDVRDPQLPFEYQHSRNPIMASAWANNIASPVFGDQDYTLSLAKIRDVLAGRGHTLCNHRGPIWNVATSDYHSMVASSGTDGAMILTNSHRGFRRRKNMPLLFERIYEMDYDLHTGNYRMLDNFLPETMETELAINRGANKKSKYPRSEPTLIKTSTWAPQVGIHRTAWQNGAGIGNAGWLASGGASGLGRIDWIAGRFTGGVVPPILGFGDSTGTVGDEGGKMDDEDELMDDDDDKGDDDDE